MPPEDKKSLLLHDVVQFSTIGTVACMFAAGIWFIADIKEAGAVTSTIQTEQGRRILHVEEYQRDMDSKLQKSVDSLRIEQEIKFNKLDVKLDRIIEREIGLR